MSCYFFVLYLVCVRELVCACVCMQVCMQEIRVIYTKYQTSNSLLKIYVSAWYNNMRFNCLCWFFKTLAWRTYFKELRPVYKTNCTKLITHTKVIQNWHRIRFMNTFTTARVKLEIKENEKRSEVRRIWTWFMHTCRPI